MAKDRSSHRRRLVRGQERAKRAERRQRRKAAWRLTEDGAGPRDLSDPQRHHRK